MQLVASVLCDAWDADGRVPGRPVLGMPEGPYLDHADIEGKEHFQVMCRRLEAAGYTLKPVPAMPDFEAIYDRHQVLMAAEAYTFHRQWLKQYQDQYHPKTLALLERGRTFREEDITKAFQGRRELRAELLDLMDEHGIDLWVSPPAPGAAPEGIDSTGNPVMSLPWTQAGFPTLSIPAGTNAAGLPLGLQVAGRWPADEALLGWAPQIEMFLSE
jgi:Asp-tRNA(Asn)/Glu-tRNA(Gln) amidotransferase A subunit family amidase